MGFAVFQDFLQDFVTKLTFPAAPPCKKARCAGKTAGTAGFRMRSVQNQAAKNTRDKTAASAIETTAAAMVTARVRGDAAAAAGPAAALRRSRLPCAGAAGAGCGAGEDQAASRPNSSITSGKIIDTRMLTTAWAR